MEDFNPNNSEDEEDFLPEYSAEEEDDDDEDEEEDENEDGIEDFPDTEDSEDDVLVRAALLEFSFKFSEYIKEMDPELWKRAVDYAMTFTKVEGVEFTKDDHDIPPSPPTT